MNATFVSATEAARTPHEPPPAQDNPAEPPEPSRAEEVEDANEWEIEFSLDRRRQGKKRDTRSMIEYLIRWKDSWLPGDQLGNALDSYFGFLNQMIQEVDKESHRTKQRRGRLHSRPTLSQKARKPIVSAPTNHSKAADEATQVTVTGKHRRL